MLSNILLEIRIKYYINYFMHDLLPTIKKRRIYWICFRIHTEFYIYHLTKYKMNLWFTFLCTFTSSTLQTTIHIYIVASISYLFANQRRNDQKPITEQILFPTVFHPYWLWSLLAMVGTWRYYYAFVGPCVQNSVWKKGIFFLCSVASPRNSDGVRPYLSARTLHAWGLVQSVLPALKLTHVTTDDTG
jgi:hypothetical protein